MAKSQSSSNAGWDPAFTNLFQHAPGYLVQLDADLIVQLAGPVFSERTSQNNGSRFLESLTAFEVKGAETLFRELAAGKHGEAAEIRLHHPCPDGESRPVDYMWVACRDAKGKCTGFTGVGRDAPEVSAIPDEELETLRAEVARLKADEQRRAREINRLRNDLESRNQRDELTNLGNRLYILDRLETEVPRAIRYDEPLTLILFDIDHLSRVNEAYGTEMGDEVLRKVAEVVREQVRNTDLAARYDGEQFLLLCPHTDRANSQFLAERLRRRVAELSFESEGEEFGITISTGLVTVTGRTEFEVEAVLRAAEEALQSAKNGGMNRVQLVEAP